MQCFIARDVISSDTEACPWGTESRTFPGFLETRLKVVFGKVHVQHGLILGSTQDILFLKWHGFDELAYAKPAYINRATRHGFCQPGYYPLN